MEGKDAMEETDNFFDKPVEDVDSPLKDSEDLCQKSATAIAEEAQLDLDDSDSDGCCRCSFIDPRTGKSSATPFIPPFQKRKPKLRTSKDVYDRLKWDAASIRISSSIETSNVYVGYKDRFLGMCELPFEEFQPGGEIPFHRIYYFRTGGAPVDAFIGTNGEVKVREDNLPEGTVFIWDRDSRTDLVFKSGNSSCLKTA